MESDTLENLQTIREMEKEKEYLNGLMEEHMMDTG